MSKWENFTAGRVAAFRCEQGKQQSIYWDGKTPGLGIRVTITGSKSYIFQTDLYNKTLRITIGDVRTWTVGKAQEEAARLKTLTDRGIDPREQYKQMLASKQAEADAIAAAEQETEFQKKYTLEALCKGYTDFLKAKGKSRSSAAAHSAFKCHILTSHPEIAAIPARSVSSLQIAAMVRKVRDSGHVRTAGVLRSYLSAAYNCAKKAPFDSSLPAELITFKIEHNPVDSIPAIPTKAGHRTLSANELVKYIDALGNAIEDQALKLALFSGGQRMAQLLRTKISDYDTSTGMLRLWDGKGKRQSAREHLIPLGPVAAKIVLRLIERAKEKKSSSLFSTRNAKNLAFTTPGKRVVEICKAMKVERFDLRDIRRTVETMLAGMGISRDIRAQLLSHGISGIQATHYDRHLYTAEKQTALISWEAKLAEITKVNPKLITADSRSQSVAREGIKRKTEHD